MARSTPAEGSSPAGTARSPGTATPARGAWAGAALGVLAAFVLGATVAPAGVAALGVASSVGLAAAVSLVTDGDPLRVAAGTLLGVPALGGIAVAVALGPALPLLAVCLAALGAAAAPSGTLGRGAFLESLGVLTYGLVPLGVAAVATTTWPVAGAVAGFVLDVVAFAGRGSGLLTASVLAVVAASALRAGVRAVPAVELAARDDREAVRAAVDAAGETLLATRRYALAGAGVGVAVWVLAVVELLPPALLAVLSATVGATLLRWVLFGAAVVGLVVTVTARVVRWTGTTLLDRARRGAAAAAGAVLTLGLAVASEDVLGTIVDGSPRWAVDVFAGLANALGVVQTVLLAATVLLLAVLFGALLLPAAVGTGIAPRRAFAPALSGAGLVLWAGLTPGQVPAVATFGAVAAAMVVWDVGEHAVGTGEEAGEGAALAPQAVHAGAGLGVGLVAAVLAWGLHSLVVPSGPGGAGPLALAGIAAAVVGVIALVAALRG